MFLPIDNNKTKQCTSLQIVAEGAMEMTKNLLKLLRGRNSQGEIAQKYNVSQQCWQSWETGRTLPDNATIFQMEKDFGIPMEVIFFDSFNYKNK